MQTGSDSRQRVLIVDDTPENIHILMESLRDEYAIMVATSGEKALSLAHGEPLPDIILLDIAMPGIDGYEVCAWLKNDDRTKQIPVIFLTAKSNLEDEHKGLELGAVDYIHKPFIPALVKTRIRNHLNLKRHQEHLEELVESRTSELRAALAAAEAASRAKSTFLATMSHELRTPLNSIIGFTDLLHRKSCGEITADQEEYLGYVLENARHLLTLINTILDFSKAEAGKLKLEASMTDIRELVAGSLHIVKESADRKQISLLGHVAEKVPASVRIDPQLVTQILVNLLSNAVKFTPDGGTVTLEIQPGSTPSPEGGQTNPETVQPGSMLISVRDTGIGIKPEDLQRIFEPFVQADNSATRNHEGSGLGLALSKMIAELHGGTIWADSAGINAGAVFFVVLPLLPGTTG